MMSNNSKIDQSKTDGVHNMEEYAKLTATERKKNQNKRHVKQMVVLLVEVLIVLGFSRMMYFNHTWDDLMAFLFFFIVLIFGNELYKDVSKPPLGEALMDDFEKYTIEEKTKYVIEQIEEQNKTKRNNKT